jgi:hypothetical protein
MRAPHHISWFFRPPRNRKRKPAQDFYPIIRENERLIAFLILVFVVLLVWAGSHQ